MRDPRTAASWRGDDHARSTARRSSSPTIPSGEWEQADGRRAARGRRRGARADLGDRARRGDGTLYAGGDPGVLFESRDGGLSWELEPHAVRAPDAAGLAAGRRRAVPALDRALAGRAGQARARAVRGRRVADRRRRRDLAPRQPGPRRALPARGAAGGDARRCACTTSSARRSAPSGCSSSSTAASTAPTTPGETLDRRSATGCRRTSASRSWSTPPTPTART